jgi:hypothetical protein
VNNTSKTIGWSIVIGALLLLLLSLPHARAHDYWADHTRVDPQTKQLCCGESDCKELSEEDIQETGAGWEIKAPDGSLQQVDRNRVMPSPDGHFWGCYWGGEYKCFFAPMNN